MNKLKTIVIAAVLLCASTAAAQTYGKRTGSGSGGTANSFGSDAAILADCQAMLGTGALTDYRYLELDDPNTYGLAIGTARGVRDDTYRGGVITMPSGGTGTAYVYPLNLVGNVVAGNVWANPSTTSWCIGNTIAITGTPISGTTIWLATLQSNVDDAITLFLTGSTSTTVLQYSIDGTNSGSSHGVSSGACNTTTAATIGTGFTAANFNRFEIAWDSAAGKMYFGVNGVAGCSVTPAGNMPTKKMSPMVVISAAANMIKTDNMFWSWVKN